MTKHDRNQILLITQGDLDDLKDEIAELLQMVKETNETLEASLEQAKPLVPNYYYPPNYYYYCNPSYQVSSGSYST